MGRKIKAFDPFNPNPNKLKRYNELLDRTKGMYVPCNDIVPISVEYIELIAFTYTNIC